MSAFQNLLAIGLFLLGTTSLWLSAFFMGKTRPPTRAAWTLVNTLALAALTGFGVAAWGVFNGYSWWPTVPLLAAVVGLVAVAPFIVGLNQIDATFRRSGITDQLVDAYPGLRGGHSHRPSSGCPRLGHATDVTRVGRR